MMEVSIIIVNYNTSHMVLDCVASLYEHTTGVEFEVIVVDNGSAIEDVVNLRNDTRFELIETGQNMGFGKANNLGAEQANGEYLFLLNPDTLLRNNAIAALYQFMQNHSSSGISGGNLFHLDLSPAHSYYVWFPSLFSEMDVASGQLVRKFLYGQSCQFNYTGKPMEVAMITGADLMIRHSIWNRIGGFDNRFFMYYEDADLCFRTAKLGYSVMSVPDAEIIHLEGQSFVETETRCRRILEGRFMYFYKHHGRVYNLIADCSNLITTVIGIIVFYLTRNDIFRQKLTLRLQCYLKIMKLK